MISLNILIKGIQSEKKLMLLIDFNRVETFGFLFFFKEEGLVDRSLFYTRHRLDHQGVILGDHRYLDALLF